MNTSLKNLLLSLLFSLFTLSHSRPSPENHLLLPSNSELAGDNALYCDSWRFSVETNNTGNWATIPSQCKDFVEKYMNGEKYISDFKIVANYSLNYAKSINISGDGKDAWVFDIDETLLSDLPYYGAHGYGSLPTNFTPSNSNNNRGWVVRSLSGEKEKAGRERKGWMIMIYDLSGSPVAAASVITPFVPSPGTDRVSRSNPGAWLILRPHGSHVSTWKPWGRLEAWRERGPIDGLGYKFELVTENGPTRTGIPIAEATMNIKKGGQFSIDQRDSMPSGSMMKSPVRGFVMASTVEGEGKMSKPLIQVGAQHVTCMADAALFIALSAAIDLSMDACRLFSHKLRKELCYDDQSEGF